MCSKQKRRYHTEMHRYMLETHRAYTHSICDADRRRSRYFTRTSFPLLFIDTKRDSLSANKHTTPPTIHLVSITTILYCAQHTSHLNATHFYLVVGRRKGGISVLRRRGASNARGRRCHRREQHDSFRRYFSAYSPCGIDFFFVGSRW